MSSCDTPLRSMTGGPELTVALFAVAAASVSVSAMSANGLPRGTWSGSSSPKPINGGFSCAAVCSPPKGLPVGTSVGSSPVTNPDGGVPVAPN